METFYIEQRGSRIAEERKRLGLTQQQTAEKCGVKRLQWIRYEKGQQKLDGDVLKAFAVIGADAGYILGGVRGGTPNTVSGSVALMQAYQAELDEISAAFFQMKANNNESGIQQVVDLAKTLAYIKKR